MLVRFPFLFILYSAEAYVKWILLILKLQSLGVH